MPSMFTPMHMDPVSAHAGPKRLHPVLTPNFKALTRTKHQKHMKSVIHPMRAILCGPVARVRRLAGLAILGAAGLGGACAWAQAQDRSLHRAHTASASSKTASPATPARDGGADTRTAVKFPAPMKQHTLANMRDHLLAISQIQEALATGKYDLAATTAEKRLGMTALVAHDAAHQAKFMPKGMQEIGTAMHRSASQFAVETQNASATGDLPKALTALSRVTQNCVACHAGYRLE